jgi:hypothetical protein
MFLDADNLYKKRKHKKQANEQTQKMSSFFQNLKNNSRKKSVSELTNKSESDR